MRGQHTVAGQHRIGFRSGRNARRQERPGRKQFLLQQRPLLLARPLLQRTIPQQARTAQQLLQGFLMEGGVLPHIYIRRMETKGLQAAAERHDEFAHDPAGAHGNQSVRECHDVRIQFRRRSIAMGRLWLFKRHQHLGAHEVSHFAPRLLTVALMNVGQVHRGLRLQGIDQTVPQRLQRFRRLLKQGAERRLVGQLFQPAPVHPQRILAQGAEGFFGDLGRDERMAVAVTADPAPKPDQGRQRIRLLGIKTRSLPGLAQMDVRTRQRLGEHLAQVVHGVLQLGINGGPRHMNLAGAPQVLDLRLQLPFDAHLLTRRVGRVVMAVHQAVDLQVPLAHGLALSLGGVRCQHRLHPHIAQHGKQVLLGDTQLAHPCEVVSPQALLSLGTGILFTQPPHLRRRPLFHDVQHLERNREGLPQRTVGLVLRLQCLAHPGQTVRQGRFAHAPQHDGKGFHQVSQIVFEHAKAVFAQGCSYHFRHVPHHSAGTVPVHERKARRQSSHHAPREDSVPGKASAPSFCFQILTAQRAFGSSRGA